MFINLQRWLGPPSFEGDKDKSGAAHGDWDTEGTSQQVFFVRDNGIGINSSYHERIFGLFDKLDPRSEGTGVGLALAKRIIEVHGGRICVESQGKD